MSTQLSVRPDAHVMSPAPCRIIGVERELQDTYTLEIEAPSKDWGFRPGQYTMMYAFGIGEVPISISGDPADSTKIVQTIRAVGAVTDALVAVQPGDYVVTVLVDNAWQPESHTVYLPDCFQEARVDLTFNSCLVAPSPTESAALMPGTGAAMPAGSLTGIPAMASFGLVIASLALGLLAALRPGR